jgi:hypothetical protein
VRRDERKKWEADACRVALRLELIAESSWHRWFTILIIRLRGGSALVAPVHFIRFPLALEHVTCQQPSLRAQRQIPQATA